MVTSSEAVGVGNIVVLVCLLDFLIRSLSSGIIVCVEVVRKKVVYWGLD